MSTDVSTIRIARRKPPPVPIESRSRRAECGLARALIPQVEHAASILFGEQWISLKMYPFRLNNWRPVLISYHIAMKLKHYTIHLNLIAVLSAHMMGIWEIVPKYLVILRLKEAHHSSFSQSDSFSRPEALTSNPSHHI